MAVKVATRDASPLVVASARSVLGAVALLAFLALTRRSLAPPPFLPTAVYGLLQTTGFTLLQASAVALGGAGRIAVLVYTMPFWLALLAWPFLGERITARRWAALALAGVGLVLVVGPLHARSSVASGLGVLGGVVWAASAVWAVRLRATGGYDLLPLTAWQMVWGSLGLLAAAPLMAIEVRWTGSLVASVLFLAVVANAVGWALWLFILSRLPAGVAGIASLATPVLGVLLAAVQLHEFPTRRELAGITVLVLALVVNARSGTVRRP